MKNHVGEIITGADINLLRWLHGRLKSGNFSLENRDDIRAAEWMDKIVKQLEAEQEKVPGPRDVPRHPFMREWA